MAVNARQKGARFERQLAGHLREYGYRTRRGQQYCGANGDADVVGLPGIHIEAKHQEKMHLYDWMEQARRDSRQDESLNYEINHVLGDIYYAVVHFDLDAYIF